MPTTVPMLAPDGTSGDIPQDQVQAAIAKGFKQAVAMTSPDGKQGYIPLDRQQDALGKGFKLITPPEKSLLQKAQEKFDALTTVTPEQEAGHSWLTNKAQEFGAGAIQGLAAPIVHPLDTLSAVGNTIAHPIDTAKAMAQAAMEHPAQALGNVVGGALLGEGAAGAASAASKVASPVVNRALLLGKTPEAAYESALKPSTTLSQAERTSIVKTALDNNIPVSKAGLRNIGNLIDRYNQAISDEIAADPNRPISTVQSMRNLDSVRAKFANQVTPQPDLAAIDEVESNFLNNPKVQPQGAGPGPGSLPATEAQAMKQGTYQALGNKAYGEVKGASIEAQKALARGLKEELANQFPEINKLNADESKLLDLQPVLERAINRTGNHQLVGIGTPIAGAATKAVTGSSGWGAAASVAKAVLDNPMVKSRLAIAISKGGGIPYAQAVAKVGAYSASLETAAQSARDSSDDQTANK